MGLYRHIGLPLGTVDQVSVVTVWYIKRYKFDEETFKTHFKARGSRSCGLWDCIIELME